MSRKVKRDRRITQAADLADPPVRELLHACAVLSDDGLWARMVGDHPMGCCYEGNECGIHSAARTVADHYLRNEDI